MSNRELMDLLISWLTISIAFALVLGDGFANIGEFPLMFVASLFGVGTGFVFHELAHRSVSRKFGAHAEYRAWSFGLLFALILAFFAGVVFAAPGAVYIAGNLSRKQNGLISLAGPATNIVIGIAFGLIMLVSVNSLVLTIARIGMFVNLWLAMFNLIPFGPLDGRKVFEWNPAAWMAFFVPLAAFFFFYYTGLF